MGLQISNNNVSIVNGFPANPIKGQIIFNTADSTFYGYTGSSWQSLSGAGGVVSDASFFYAQTVPANEWIITHNLGKFPSVRIMDNAGRTVNGFEVTDISVNITKITLGISIAGNAILN